MLKLLQMSRVTNALKPSRLRPLHLPLLLLECRVRHRCALVKRLLLSLQDPPQLVLPMPPKLPLTVYQDTKDESLSPSRARRLLSLRQGQTAVQACERKRKLLLPHLTCVRVVMFSIVVVAHNLIPSYSPLSVEGSEPTTICVTSISQPSGFRSPELLAPRFFCIYLCSKSPCRTSCFFIRRASKLLQRPRRRTYSHCPYASTSSTQHHPSTTDHRTPNEQECSAQGCKDGDHRCCQGSDSPQEESRFSMNPHETVWSDCAHGLTSSCTYANIVCGYRPHTPQGSASVTPGCVRSSLPIYLSLYLHL